MTKIVKIDNQRHLGCEEVLKKISEISHNLKAVVILSVDDKNDVMVATSNATVQEKAYLIGFGNAYLNKLLEPEGLE